MEGQVAGQDADRDGQDEPEGPPVADEAALAEAVGQVDGAGHGGDVDDDVEQHQFVADEDPVGKESGHDERHDGQPAQDGRTERTPSSYVPSRSPSPGKCTPGSG